MLSSVTLDLLLSEAGPPVFAGVLGGVVLFKQDFTEQYRDALTFIPL